MILMIAVYFATTCNGIAAWNTRGRERLPNQHMAARKVQNLLIPIVRVVNDLIDETEPESCQSLFGKRMLEFDAYRGHFRPAAPGMGDGVASGYFLLEQSVQVDVKFSHVSEVYHLPPVIAASVDKTPGARKKYRHLTPLED